MFQETQVNRAAAERHRGGGGGGAGGGASCHLHQQEEGQLGPQLRGRYQDIITTSEHNCKLQ